MARFTALSLMGLALCGGVTSRCRAQEPASAPWWCGPPALNGRGMILSVPPTERLAPVPRYDPAEWATPELLPLWKAPRPDSETVLDGADEVPRKARSQVDQPWGSLTSSQAVLGTSRSAADNPLSGNGWQMEEALDLPVTGSVFFFGKVGAGDDYAAAQEFKLAGRTGVGWKLPLSPGLELQFRSGSAMSYRDPLRAIRLQGNSQLLLEMQCRCPLPGQAGLEYLGSAYSPLNPADRDHLDHDLRVVVPVGKAGELRVGAKQSWDNFVESQLWTNRFQLHLDSGLKW